MEVPVLLLLLLVCLFTTVPCSLGAIPVPDQLLPAEGERFRVLILVDGSYSMYRTLPGQEAMPLEEVLQQLDQFLPDLEDAFTNADGSITWDWVLFSDGNGYERIASGPRGIDPFRTLQGPGDFLQTSDIAGALKRGAASFASGEGGLIILLSDLLQTEELETPIIDSSIPLLLICPTPYSSKEGLPPFLSRWKSLFIFQPGDGLKSLGESRGVRKHLFEVRRYGGAVPGADPPETTFPVNPFLLPLPVLLMVLLRRFFLRLFRHRPGKRVPPVPASGWRVSLIITRKGTERTDTVIISADAPSVGVELPGAESFSIALEEGELYLHGAKPLLVDGVSTCRRRLRGAGLIKTSGYTIRITGVDRTASGPGPGLGDVIEGGRGSENAGEIATHQWACSLSTFPPLTAALAFLFLIPWILPAWISNFRSPAEELAGSHGTPMGHRSFLVEYTLSGPEPVWSDYPRLEGPARSTPAPRPPRFLDLTGRDWRGIASLLGSPDLESPEIDVLLIHAHPDDEAIDFGALLAALEVGGKSTAVLLFTRGESGLIRGPYGNRSRPREERIAIRHEETLASMGILGVELYLNLGLTNHPYGSSAAVPDLPLLLDRWGGEKELILMLKEIIRGLDPEVIISIDGPSEAHVHFEHEGAGFLSRKVVEELLAELRTNLRLREGGFLQAIPLLWTGRISGTQSVLVDQRPSPEALSPREVQLQALNAHRSQIDSYIIGLEYAPHFSETEFRSIFWNREESPEEFITRAEP